MIRRLYLLYLVVTLCVILLILSLPEGIFNYVPFIQMALYPYFFITYYKMNLKVGNYLNEVHRPTMDKFRSRVSVFWNGNLVNLIGFLLSKEVRNLQDTKLNELIKEAKTALILTVVSFFTIPIVIIATFSYRTIV